MKQLSQKAMDYRLGIFMVLCLILGGTSQDVVAPKLPLYIISLFLICWAALKINSGSRIWKLKALAFFAGAFLVLNLLYLIPLPPAVWTGLPGREVIQSGYEVLGMELPWLPLSLTPERSLYSLFDILPPLAVLSIIGVLASMREIRLTILIVVGFAVLTVLLGLLQISDISTNLYFYDFTNDNVMVGFFSNSNHQASFLLMVLPFSLGASVMLTRSYRSNDREGNSTIFLGYVCLVFLLIGVLLTGSFAGYLLAIPTLLGALYYCTSNRDGNFKLLSGVAIILVLGVAVDFLFLGSYLAEFIAKLNDVGSSTRPEIFATTYTAAKVYLPFGTGMGSFASVYKLYEQAGINTIPHSHNEYLEILLEFGILGIIISGMFILWLSAHVWRSLKTSRSSMVMTRCASLSVLVVLIHSLVDYPLRTISVSVFFMFCLCLVVLSKDIFAVRR